MRINIPVLALFCISLLINTPIVALSSTATNVNDSISAKIVTTEDNKTVLAVTHENQIYEYGISENPDKVSIKPYEAVLNHDGIVLQSKKNYPFSYYFLYWNDGLKVLAESWGEFDDFYVVDINDDGNEELITNLTYGDGGTQCRVYFTDGDGEIKYVSPRYVSDPDGDKTIWTTYDPHSNKIKVYSPISDYGDIKLEGICVNKFDLSLSDIGIEYISNTTVSFKGSLATNERAV